jgi:hypothetical protein
MSPNSTYLAARQLYQRYQEWWRGEDLST